MFDAPMGYHQLAVALASQAKLASQGVDAIKWKYTVMPFGPTNGPATFINFDDPFGEWITDCVLMATRLEPNNGQTAHTKLSRVDE